MPFQATLARETLTQGLQNNLLLSEVGDNLNRERVSKPTVAPHTFQARLSSLLPPTVEDFSRMLLPSHPESFDTGYTDHLSFSAHSKPSFPRQHLSNVVSVR